MIKKNLTSIALVGALALNGINCVDKGDKPEIKEVADLTGDGIKDILMYDHQMNVNFRGEYLFIGQENGEFIRAKGYNTSEGIKYFKTDDGVAYFFDGNFYRPSPERK